jgi:hypothetical protein
MLDAMGANSTPIPFGEVFTGLQTHLIDAAENNWATFQSTRQCPSSDDLRHLSVFGSEALAHLV